MADHLEDGGIRELDHSLVEAILLEHLGHQVLLRDLQLLALDVAGNLDDLHPILQRSWDLMEHVGRADEHHT